jgi:hypothetical protein
MWSHRDVILFLLFDPDIMHLLRLPLRVGSNHILMLCLFCIILFLLILIEHGVLLQIWSAIESLRKVCLPLCNFGTTSQLIKGRRIPGLVKRDGLTDGFLIRSLLLDMFDLTEVNTIGSQCFDLLHQCFLVIGTA